MKIHYLQHVPFEDPANILGWAELRGHKLSRTLLYEGDALPENDAFDALIIMGGPMSVHDEALYPWLVQEKEFIGKAIAAGKPILGICLGAQLIAECLGAEVMVNPQKEIGWFPVRLTSEVLGLPIAAALPYEFNAFHWHGETFGIPKGAVRLGNSEATENQGFLYGDRVIGLQFHLESTRESVAELCSHGEQELLPGPFVQSASMMLAEDKFYKELEAILLPILDRWSNKG